MEIMLPGEYEVLKIMKAFKGAGEEYNKHHNDEKKFLILEEPYKQSICYDLRKGSPLLVQELVYTYVNMRLMRKLTPEFKVWNNKPTEEKWIDDIYGFRAIFSAKGIFSSMWITDRGAHLNYEEEKIKMMYAQYDQSGRMNILYPGDRGFDGKEREFLEKFFQYFILSLNKYNSEN
jgi:hypothetical protein